MSATFTRTELGSSPPDPAVSSMPCNPASKPNQDLKPHAVVTTIGA